MINFQSEVSPADNNHFNSTCSFESGPSVSLKCPITVGTLMRFLPFLSKLIVLGYIEYAIEAKI